MRPEKKCLMPTLNVGESEGLDGVKDWRKWRAGGSEGLEGVEGWREWRAGGSEGLEGVEGWREWRSGGLEGRQGTDQQIMLLRLQLHPLFWANRTQQVSRCQQKELPRLFSTRETG